MADFLTMMRNAIPDQQFYQDVGNRLYDALAAGVKDITPQPGDTREQKQEKYLTMGMGLGPGAIRAWHGSPHPLTMGRSMQMSKVGTGEGSQAEGHGLYAAETKEVGKSYSQLHDYGSGWLYPHDNVARESVAKLANTGNKDAAYLQQFISKNPGVKISELADEYLGSLFGMQKNVPYDNAVKMLENAGLRKPTTTGSLYKLELSHPNPAKEAATPLSPNDFLQWDKPLSQQPEKVKNALMKLNKNIGDNTTTGQLAGQPGYHFFDKKSGYLDIYMTPMKTEQEAKAWLANPLGRDWYQWLAGGGPSLDAPQASEMLRKAGIPGVRYLDANSRAAGQGTHNYVVFDEKIPKVLSKE